MQFPELTYAQPNDPWAKRWTIRAIEQLAGRNYFVPLYMQWKNEIIPSGGAVIEPVLKLIDVDLRLGGATWPPDLDENAPLVIVANHPFGIVDGLSALALAERLGRPFRVLIHKDLLKVPEIRPYSLAVDFGETKEAVANNIEMRREALRLLKAGTTIVVFPAGGVATSPTPWGRAVDLPWKVFTSRMILESKAQVLPIYFEGQNSALFHAVSLMSLTLRLSLIVRELRTHCGKPVTVRVGEVIPFEKLAGKDRKSLTTELYEAVHALSDMSLETVRSRMERLPGYLLGAAANGKSGASNGAPDRQPRPR
jgi:putative hemolysin